MYQTLYVVESFSVSSTIFHTSSVGNIQSDQSLSDRYTSVFANAVSKVVYDSMNRRAWFDFLKYRDTIFVFL